MRVVCKREQGCQISIRQDGLQAQAQHCQKTLRTPYSDKSISPSRENNYNCIYTQNRMMARWLRALAILEN